MPLFPSPSKGITPKTYGDFWRGLSKDSKFGPLFDYQARILEQYFGLGADVRDIAICLPTGTGKTAVALVIARFTQVQSKQRVLYLCPNNQLAAQVHQEARQLGIPTVLLTGTWRSGKPNSVPEADKDAFYRCDAVGVASYWTLFNSNPPTGDVGLVLLDDVHAAADATLSPWKLEISAAGSPDLYADLIALLRGQVPAAQLVALSPGAPEGREVELVRTRDWLMVADAVGSLLSKHESEPGEVKANWEYAWRMMRGALDVSFCFLSAETITIRPWAPPAYDLAEFRSANRRVYLSATLDKWGHIEDVTGMDGIDRLTDKDVPPPGRRLILNLQRLFQGMDDINRVSHMARYAIPGVSDKATVLCRSARDRDDVIRQLKRDGYKGQILGTSQNIEDDVASFRKPGPAILVLANRYDGLDLGQNLCRVVVMWKLPAAIGLQEEFTTNVWRMQDSAEARARHRIQQGMGRCTRHESDAVVVGLVGRDLLEFIQRPDVERALPRRIQAELDVGLQVTNAAEFDAYVEACLKRTEDWKSAAQSMEATASNLPEEVQKDEPIAEVHRRKARYSKFLWQRSFDAAAKLAHGAAQVLVDKKREDSAAIWFYLASCARDLQEHAESGNPFSIEGTALLKEASYRADGRVWFGQLADFAIQHETQITDSPQVDALEAWLSTYPAQTGKLDEVLASARADLSQAKAGRYHNGLETLGRSLGFEVRRPKRSAAPDSIWHLDGEAIAIIEAKTDKESPTLAAKEVQQILAHPGDVANNENLRVSSGTRPLTITPCDFIAAERAHELSQFDVARPGEVLAFAERWFDRLSGAHKRTSLNPKEMRYVLQALLRQERLLGTAALDRIGRRPAQRVLKSERT